MLESISARDLDLITETGLIAFGDLLCEQLRKAFDSAGRLATGAALIATRGQGQQPGIIYMLDESTAPGCHFSTTVKEMARDHRATGVFFFAETWSVNFASEEERLIWRGRDWGKHPRAKEKLHCTFEHLQFQPRSWHAYITRDPAGTGIVGPFECHEVAKTRGALTNFLQGAREAAANAN